MSGNVDVVLVIFLNILKSTAKGILSHLRDEIKAAWWEDIDLFNDLEVTFQVILMLIPLADDPFHIPILAAESFRCKRHIYGLFPSVLKVVLKCTCSNWKNICCYGDILIVSFE